MLINSLLFIRVIRNLPIPFYFLPTMDTHFTTTLCPPTM